MTGSGAAGFSFFASLTSWLRFRWSVQRGVLHQTPPVSERVRGYDAGARSL